MSQPHQKPISRTMFVVEGINTAMLVTAIAGRKPRRKTVPITSPESALTWCRQHSAGLVYTPAVPGAGN